MFNAGERGGKTAQNLRKEAPSFMDRPIDICIAIMGKLQDKNPKACSDWTWTPLHAAAENGHAGVCLAILDHLKDKNPTAKEMFWKYYEIPKTSHLQISHDIKEWFSNEHTNGTSTETPLHLAAGSGLLEVCQVIMEQLDNKNPSLSYKGETPLHYAAGKPNDGHGISQTFELKLSNQQYWVKMTDPKFSCPMSLSKSTLPKVSIVTKGLLGNF